MLKIAIICIGDELLKGSTVNTNLAFIGERLTQEGAPPVFAQEVPDTEAGISGALERALAEAVGLHESHIHCLEKGRYLPRICTARRVADGLGVPMDELLRDGKKRPRVMLNGSTFDRAARGATP